MKFDTLEIQKNIEEKRLILGQEFSDSLLKTLGKISDFFSKILAAKSTAFLGSVIIIAISILAQSSRDLGHDSATYPEIAEKMLTGGRYFYDFFESNLPLNFVMTMIPLVVAQKFDFNIIATAQIFWNLLGICSIYFSHRILIRSELSRDITVFNLIFLTLTAGFFWRVFTLQFNEFGTKSTYLLALLFPYISYHLLGEEKLKNFDHILIGILAGLLFCFKPHYGIFVVVFELEKIIKTRNIRMAFCLRNYVSLVILIGYLATLFKFFPDYIDNLPKFVTLYYHTAPNLIYFIFARDLSPILLLVVLSFDELKKTEIARRLFLPISAAALLVLSELIGGLDQRYVFYSISLPLVAVTILYLIRNQRINWQRDGFVILAILLLPQFDPYSTFFVISNISCFWWVFLWLIWKKINLPTKLGFAALAPLTTLALSFSNFVELSLSSSSAILILVIFLNQKLSAAEKLPRLSVYAIFLVLSYFISLNISAILNLKSYHDYNKFSSPNHFTSEMIEVIKHYSDKSETIVSISSIIPGTYPQIIYAGKRNNSPALQSSILFYRITGEKEQEENGVEYLLPRLKANLESKNNKLVIVEINHYLNKTECPINFLEYYFRDVEFKKIFLENYVFLTRIIDTNKSFKDQERIDRDAEVYIRK